ncbi:MAG: hypothetical protein M1838_005609 [Thelocarpon superellum]|nr:MAG: hypothetical protein M1838_005609 [Thelocarpon superellum]
MDLSAAVDVYAEWIDACDAVAKTDARDKGERGAGLPYDDGPPARASARSGGLDEYEEAGIDDTGVDDMHDDD